MTLCGTLYSAHTWTCSLAQVANFCEYGDEPFGSVRVWNFLSSAVTVSFARRTLFHGTALSEVFLNLGAHTPPLMQCFMYTMLCTMGV